MYEYTADIRMSEGEKRKQLYTVLAIKDIKVIHQVINLKYQML